MRQALRPKHGLRIQDIEPGLTGAAIADSTSEEAHFRGRQPFASIAFRRCRTASTIVYAVQWRDPGLKTAGYLANISSGKRNLKGGKPCGRGGDETWRRWR